MAHFQLGGLVLTAADHRRDLEDLVRLTEFVTQRRAHLVAAGQSTRDVDALLAKLQEGTARTRRCLSQPPPAPDVPVG